MVTWKIVLSILTFLLSSAAWPTEWQEVLGPDTSLSTHQTENTRTTMGVLGGKDFYSVTIHGDEVSTTTGWWGDEDIHCTSYSTDVTEEFRCD